MLFDEFKAALDKEGIEYAAPDNDTIRIGKSEFVRWQKVIVTFRDRGFPDSFLRVAVIGDVNSATWCRISIPSDIEIERVFCCLPRYAINQSLGSPVSDANDVVSPRFRYAFNAKGRPTIWLGPNGEEMARQFFSVDLSRWPEMLPILFDALREDGQMPEELEKEITR